LFNKRLLTYLLKAYVRFLSSGCTLNEASVLDSGLIFIRLNMDCAQCCR